MLSLLALFACEPAPPPPPPPAPECDLTLDGLADRTFVLTKKTNAGAWEGDKLGRLHFFKEGTQTKVKYTVRSLTSVYTYTCVEKKTGELECLQDNPDLVEFCRALWGNMGTCNEKGLAQVTGVDPASPALKVAVDGVNAEVAKLSAADQEQMKRSYGSNEGMQLRGLLRVRVKATDDECRLSVDDLFQNFSHGKALELENVVGSGARFVKSSSTYVFEDCRDVNTNLVALADPKAKAKPGETTLEWSTGQNVAFRYVGADANTEEAGCAYTMDAFYDYEPVMTAAPVQKGDDGKPYWGFTKAASKAGRVVAHLYRYKSCGGAAPTLVSVSCAAIKAE